MKNLISLLVIILFIFGCGNKKENKTVGQKDKYAFDSSDVKASPIENPNQNFFVRYNFEKNKNYRYRITTLSNDIQTIKTDSTMTQVVHQSIIYLMDVELKNVEKDSTLEFSCKFNSIKLNADVNGNKFNYQSGVTPDSINREKYADYEALINNPFSVRVSNLGNILEVFRADKIVSKFIEMKGMKDSLTTAQKESVRQSIIDAGLKPLLLLVFRKIPSQSVAKDSSWSVQQPESQLMVYKISTTTNYKVSNLEKLNGDKLATIDANANIKVTGNDKVTNRGVTYTFKKPESTASGKIFFNLTKGLVQKARTHTEIKIFYTMEMRGQKGSKSEVIKNTNISELL